MKTIGERLAKALDYKGFKPNKASALSGVHASTIKNWLDNNGTPDAIKLEKVSNVLGIRFVWLKDGEGEMIHEERINVEDENVIKPEFVRETTTSENKNSNKFIELPNGQYYMTMPLAEFNIQAGLLSNYQDADYLMDLNQHGMVVEKPVQGRYVAFRVSGDSMDNGSIESIPRNSIVSTRELQRHLWTSKLRIKDFPYWVIYSTQSKMPLLKEIIDHNVEEGYIVCHSLNDSPEYTDFTLSLNDVQALFYVIDKSTTVSKKLVY